MSEDIICGMNAVRALFQRRANDVLRLYYTAPLRALAGPLCAQLAERRPPYRELPPDEMQKAAGTTHHGGIAAVAKPRAIAFLDIDSPPQVRLLLVVDQAANPYNLGAIARCAAFFGVGALLLHETRLAAMPSDAVHRTAEGGLEYLDLYRTKDLARAIHGLDRHYRTAAVTLRAQAAPFASLPRDRPLALVLGNEEHGVSLPVLQACRREIRIEGAGHMQSLGIAQTAAILLQAYTAPAAKAAVATAPAGAA
jgi:RNA methyltransferase, TrmH family